MHMSLERRHMHAVSIVILYVHYTGDRHLNDSIYPNVLCTTQYTAVATLCLKKVLTFELSVTLSNLNRFSKLLHFTLESV